MPTPGLKRFRLAVAVALAASLAIAGVFVVRKVREEPTANWVRTDQRQVPLSTSHGELRPHDRTTDRRRGPAAA
jgi:hypothetical protein